MNKHEKLSNYQKIKGFEIKNSRTPKQIKNG